MRRKLALTLVGGLALTATACPPKKPPEPAVDVGAEAIIRPTVARSWAELTPGLYPELADGPAPVDLLRASHDVRRWTYSQRHWGPQSVVQYEDTDRPERAVGAVAAWVLGDDDRIDAVILRDYVDPPTAATRDELLLGLAEVWPPPWSLCRPSAEEHADLVIAVDESGRRKLGLVSSVGEKEVWTVDHVAELSAGTDLVAWFERKGYGSCQPMGTLLENGKLKPPPESDQDSPPSPAAP